MTSLKKEEKGQSLVDILGISFSGSLKKELLKQIETKLKKRERCLIFTPNPEILLKARSSQTYTDSLNSADILLPDGFGLTLISRLMYGKKLERIPGRLFMEELLKLADREKSTVYFLGSTRSVIQSTILKTKSKYPNIKVFGSPGPTLNKVGEPVSKVAKDIYKDTFRHIKMVSPRFLFVAFGAPKQEFFITKNLDTFKSTIVMGIGGSLDTYSGHIPPPPELLVKVGLEWLWRLIVEPKRIGRVVSATLIFPFFATVEALKKKALS